MGRERARRAGQRARPGDSARGSRDARGGIGGRLIEQVVVDVDIFSPDGVDRAFRPLLEADVDVMPSH